MQARNLATQGRQAPTSAAGRAAPLPNIPEARAIMSAGAGRLDGGTTGGPLVDKPTNPQTHKSTCGLFLDRRSLAMAY